MGCNVGFAVGASVLDAVGLPGFQPQGRAHRIRKRSNHVTLVVDSMNPVAATTEEVKEVKAEKPKKATKKVAKKAAKKKSTKKETKE